MDPTLITYRSCSLFPSGSLNIQSGGTATILPATSYPVCRSLVERELSNRETIFPRELSLFRLYDNIQRNRLIFNCVIGGIIGGVIGSIQNLYRPESNHKFTAGCAIAGSVVVLLIRHLSNRLAPKEELAYIKDNEYDDVLIVKIKKEDQSIKLPAAFSRFTRRELLQRWI